MKTPLPAWVVSNRASVEAEAKPYLNLSPDERARLTRAACRAAAKQLAHRADAATIYAYRDALPESTVRALARLREIERRGRGALK